MKSATAKGKKPAARAAVAGRAARGAAALAALEKLRGEIPWAFDADGEFLPEEVLGAVRGMNVGPAERGARYRFDWAGSQEAFNAMRAPAVAALRPRRDLSVDFDDTRNIFICGDNLEALKLLQPAYAGRVKLIYIDPPYNTGNDFVYRDNFRDPLAQYLRETGQADENGKALRAAARAAERKLNGRKHSNWMSMMFPRLFLAREFLSDDGVMFVSIDDNEVHHLRLLMNIVFGEDNHVGTITVRSNPRGSQASKFLAGVHEYVMAYCKDHQRADLRGYAKSADDEEEYGLVDENGRYRLLGLRQRGGAWKKEQREKLHYPIYVDPDNGEVALEKTGRHTVECVPRRPTGEPGRWTWSPDKIRNNPGTIVGKRVRRNGAEAWDVFRKDYFSGESGDPKASKPKTIWDDREINYQNGRREVKALFDGRDVFDFPKPMHLLKKCVGMMDCRDGVVMDFFAGSATLAHAVMELNADGGRRQCVSVQLPEPTPDKSEARQAGFLTVADIGLERLRRAGAKIREAENGSVLAAKVDAGFRVYEMTRSMFRPWAELDGEKATMKDWLARQEAALEVLPEKPEAEALAAEVMLQEGYPLSSRVERFKAGRSNIWRVSHPTLAAAGKVMHLCLDRKVPDDLIFQLGLLDRPASRVAVLERAVTDSVKVTLGSQCDLRTL